MTTPPNTAETSQQAPKNWRGVAAEREDEIPDKVSLLLKARSRRLLGSLLGKHRRVLFWMLVAVVIENATRLSVPYLVGKGIDDGIPPITQGHGSSTLVEIVVLVLSMVVFQAITRQIFLMMSGRLGQDVLLDLRRRMFRHFQKLSPAFHDEYTSGRVISRQTSDIDAIYELLETGFDGLITAMLTLVGTAVILLFLDVKLGLVALVCFPFLGWLTRWFRRQSGIAYRRTRETVAVVIVHFVETINGMRAVQAFRREPRNQAIFDSVNDDYRWANERAFRLVGVFMPGIKIIGNLTTGIVLIYGAHRAFNGDITVGVLTAFLLYLRQFFEPMQDVSQFYNTFQSASAALEKLSGVLEEEPSVAEPAEPTPLPRPEGALRLQDVEFSYVESRPVIPHLSLDIPAGQTLALVGTTGAGKTTLAKLLARFYDPKAGSITLDGVDLRRLTEHDLRTGVVMVTQENYLFNGSVADNIR
jgi:ABC-type multidrug transport system fused ATPase/permease subunit